MRYYKLGLNTGLGRSISFSSSLISLAFCSQNEPKIPKSKRGWAVDGLDSNDELLETILSSGNVVVVVDDFVDVVDDLVVVVDVVVAGVVVVWDVLVAVVVVSASVVAVVVITRVDASVDAAVDVTVPSGVPDGVVDVGGSTDVEVMAAVVLALVDLIEISVGKSFFKGGMIPALLMPILALSKVSFIRFLFWSMAALSKPPALVAAAATVVVSTIGSSVAVIGSLVVVVVVVVAANLRRL